MTKRNGAFLARIAPAMALLALLFLSSAVVVDAGRKVKAPKAPKAVEVVEPKTAADVMGSMNTQVRGEAIIAACTRSITHSRAPRRDLVTRACTR